MSYVVRVLDSLQDFQDSFVGPFVYVVPNETESSVYLRNGKETNSEEESEEKNGVKIIMVGGSASKCLCLR